MRSHFANELTAEGVDDTGNGGSATLANEVEVEHTLHSARLHTAISGQLMFLQRAIEWNYSLDEASCLGVEESVLFEGAEEARGRVEAGDVVVGRLNAVRGSDRRHLEYIVLCSVSRLSQTRPNCAAVAVHTRRATYLSKQPRHFLVSWINTGRWTEGVG